MPRKPKFTNRKVLDTLTIIAGFVMLVGAGGGYALWMPLFVLAFAGIFVVMFLTRQVDKLNTWELSQKVNKRSSGIKRVRPSFTLKEFQSLLRELPKSSPVHSMLVEMVLEDGETFDVVASGLKAGRGAPTGVNYETHQVKGQTEYDEMKFI